MSVVGAMQASGPVMLYFMSQDEEAWQTTGYYAAAGAATGVGIAAYFRSWIGLFVLGSAGTVAGLTLRYYLDSDKQPLVSDAAVSTFFSARQEDPYRAAMRGGPWNETKGDETAFGERVTPAGGALRASSSRG